MVDQLIVYVIYFIITIQTLFFVFVCYLCFKIWKSKINISSVSSKLVDFINADWTTEQNVVRNVIKTFIKFEEKGKSISFNDLTEIIYLESSQYDRRIISFVNSEIILGLIGTFIGVIIGLSNIDFTKIKDIDRILDTFKGDISIAFYAGATGIFFLLLGNLVFALGKSYRESNIGDFVNLILSDLMPQTASVKPEERIYQSVDKFSEKVEELKNGLENSLATFHEQFKEMIDLTTKQFDDALQKVLTENKISLSQQTELIKLSEQTLSSTKTEIISRFDNLSQETKKQVDSLSKTETDFSKHVESQNKYIEEVIKNLTTLSTTNEKYSQNFDDIITKLNTLTVIASTNLVQLNSSILSTQEVLSKEIADNIKNVSQKMTEETKLRLLVLEKQNNDIQKQYLNSLAKMSDIQTEINSNQQSINSNYVDSLNRINELNTNLEKKTIDLTTVISTILNEVEVKIKTDVEILINSFGAILPALSVLNTEFPNFSKQLLGIVENMEIEIKAFDKIVDSFGNKVSGEVNKYFVSITQFKTLFADHAELISKRIRNFEDLQILSNQISDNLNKITDEKFNVPINNLQSVVSGLKINIDAYYNTFTSKMEEIFKKIINEDGVDMNYTIKGDGREIKILAQTLTLEGLKKQFDKLDDTNMGDKVKTEEIIKQDIPTERLHGMDSSLPANTPIGKSFTAAAEENWSGSQIVQIGMEGNQAIDETKKSWKEKLIFWKKNKI